MGIGPFSTYAPPGVFTRSIISPVVGQLLNGLRVPLLIGVGQETLTQSDYEMIRGSSSVADTPIFGEDPTSRWVTGGTNANPTLGLQDGNLSILRVRNYPIVDGTGVGKTTYETNRVSVTVNGEPNVVAAVDGANGLVTLLVPPSPTDTVSVNYFFNRSDTRITDTLSSQVTVGTATLISPSAETYAVVAGTSDVLQVYLNDSTSPVAVTLTPGTRLATDIVNDINNAAITGLTAAIDIDNQGLYHVQIMAAGNLLIGSGTANGALGFNPGDYTSRNRTFRVFNGPIVDGSGGGIITTDTSKVVVLVNGIQVIPSQVDGANGTVTLVAAPAATSSVTIQYYFNTWQDTFDYLPNSNIVTMGNVGIAPGRRDYLNGPDFTVVNEGDQSKIYWGSAFQISSSLVTGSVAFDSVQVYGLLVDDRIFGVEATRYTDPSTNTVSTRKFVLPLTPTTGNGRDTPLGSSLYQTVTNSRIDLPTNRPDLVTVYVGTSFRDAYSRPAVTVLEVDSATNTVTLRDAVSADGKAYATFWYSRLAEDTYTLKVVTPGPSGIGKFTVTSALLNNAPLYQVKFGAKAALAQTVQWPSGTETVPDAIHYGGTPVSETVTVEFNSALLPATHASFSTSGAEPYDLYTASRSFGGVKIDGAAAFAVDMTTAFKAQLYGQPVATTLAFVVGEVLVLQIDDVVLAPIDVSACTSLTDVVAAINTQAVVGVDNDIQVHADGSGTFLSTAANNLASVVTYGTKRILKIQGRNTKSATNGLASNVKVLTPSVAGQINAATKCGLTTNQVVYGQYSALNHPAELVGTADAPYAIQAGVDDFLSINIDGTDYSTDLPAGAAVTLVSVADYIQAAYAASGPAADQATLLADAIALANSERTKYEAHRVMVGGPPKVHIGADGANVITAIVSNSLATLLLLANDLKAMYNAHIATAGAVHLVADTVHQIVAADATDLQSAIILVTEIRDMYNLHRVDLTYHAVADATNTVTAAITQLVARVGAGANANKLVLVSRVNTTVSYVGVNAVSTCLGVLGFVSGASASQWKPTADAIAGALNANASFLAAAVAWPVVVSGLGSFVKIDSLTAGASSSIAFTSVANTAFIPETGLGIVVGTSGDVGEAATAGYYVTSSNPNGSSGIGTPGQTYTDAITGLRFTVLPASAGTYDTAGKFTLIISSLWTADAAIPSKAIPGLELTVFNTLNISVDSTALVQTFNKGGSEPAIGDVYYTSYQYGKTDLDTGLFQDLKKIQQNFGPPTPEFPLSLAARIALLNGAVLLGLKQVLKASGSGQAAAGSFTTAIDEQRKPIAGSVKPDIIVPLCTDPDVFAYLNQHCVFMSAPRQQGERISIVGTAAGTTPTGARSVAQGLQSELMIVTYPDRYVVSVQDDVGNIFDQLVDSSYMAAALAGVLTNPASDVAVPLTRRQVIGFKKIGRVLDPTEANQTAVSGVSVIELISGTMRVRHGLTTNMSSVITRTPSVVLTIQLVQQTVRRVLDPMIGQKFTPQLLKSAETALLGMSQNLMTQQILSKVAGIKASVDENDPTIMISELIFVPIFPLEYISHTSQIRLR
jgi:hypothetical protein